MNEPAPHLETLSKRPKSRCLTLYAERLVALGLALLLLRSSFAHLGNPYLFLSTVYSYDILPIELGRWLAFLLPYLQIVVAAALVSTWWLREAYMLAAAMFAAFALAQTFVLWKGLEIPCGCFGASESLQVGWATLLVAVMAALAAGLGLLLTILWLGKLHRSLAGEAST